ncbi:hypothetical protein [Alkalibacillus aidingensis]|nr:hypothetical protein [Alkalibacillus aidingensis]
MNRVISTGVMGAAALYLMRNRGGGILSRRNGLVKQLRKSGRRLRRRVF